MKTNYILTSNAIAPMIPNIVFFWIRIVISMFLFSSFRKPSFHPCRHEALMDDTIYILQFNMFLFYFVLSSLSQGNVLGYFLSIIMMIHNAGLTLLILLTNQASLSKKDLICSGIFAASYILEAFLAVYTSYLKRNEMSFEFFKKVGANPKINDSYVTRKRLQTFGTINIFISTAILGKIIFPPFSKYSATNWVVILIIAFTYVQQIFVSVNMNDEDVPQRNTAIYMSFANIFLLVAMIVFTALYSFRCVASTREVQAFVYADMLIIKIVMNVYLRSDREKFGSGLKEFFISRSQILDLSK